MILILAVVSLISLFCLLAEVRAARRHGACASRRALTGCEIARYALDVSGCPQITVGPAESGRAGAFDFKQLRLPLSVYSGKTLLDIARAAWQAVLIARVPGTPLIEGIKKKFWGNSGWLIGAGWVLFAAGFLRPGWGWITHLGFWSVVFFFVLAFIDLPMDWDAGEKSVELLAGSHQFDVDEIVRLKKIIKALRFRKFGWIVKVPARMFSARFSLSAERE